MTDKPENPPAFPQHPDAPYLSVEQGYGMTLRDYFAGQALASFTSGTRKAHEDAGKAYRIADAMLAERERGQ